MATVESGIIRIAKQSPPRWFYWNKLLVSHRFCQRSVNHRTNESGKLGALNLSSISETDGLQIIGTEIQEASDGAFDSVRLFLRRSIIREIQ